jgi:hypothetical protein
MPNSIVGNLPSSDSAKALVRGERGALPLVIAHTGFRALIIAFGLACVRDKEPLKHALAGAVAIEIFVLMWEASEQKIVVPSGLLDQPDPGHHIVMPLVRAVHCGNGHEQPKEDPEYVFASGH